MCTQVHKFLFRPSFLVNINSHKYWLLIWFWIIFSSSSDKIKIYLNLWIWVWHVRLLAILWYWFRHSYNYFNFRYLCMHSSLPFHLKKVLSYGNNLPHDYWFIDFCFWRIISSSRYKNKFCLHLYSTLTCATLKLHDIGFVIVIFF